MKLNIPRFSLSNSPFGTSGGALGASSYLSPSPFGDWCRYEEACKVVEEALATLTAEHEASKPPTPMHLHPLCHRKIEVPETRGIQVTYCMQDKGHKGDCK